LGTGYSIREIFVPTTIFLFRLTEGLRGSDLKPVLAMGIVRQTMRSVDERLPDKNSRKLFSLNPADTLRSREIALKVYRPVESLLCIRIHGSMFTEQSAILADYLSSQFRKRSRIAFDCDWKQSKVRIRLHIKDWNYRL